MLKLAELKAPAIAGTVSAITGAAVSTGVIIAAYSGLGANQGQIASAVSIMVLLYGLLSIFLSWRYKMPISIVWSTAGAALLLASATLGFSFETSVGAFLVCGLLIVLTGIWGALGRLVARIPKSIASAMLAGVIFPFCVAPFTAAVEYPVVVLPAILAWLVLYRLANVWASPVAIAVIFLLITLTMPLEIDTSVGLLPLQLVAVNFDLAAIVGISIPLYLVTMASQNIPGVAILKSFGYDVPFRASMVTTGGATVAGSLFGGYSLNLSAITAAMNANEQAHPDPSKRWLSSAFGGIIFVVGSIFAGLATAFVLATPRELLLSAAGLALISTMVSALSSAVEVTEQRVAAVTTFLITASGVAAFGIGSAFWALLAGVVVWQWLERREKKTSAS